MKVVVALDKFKGSLDAPTACRIVADAIRETRREIEVIQRPMADGGDGTAAALVEALAGQWISREVTGPLPTRRVPARYGWLPAERTAIIEMATASGLALLKPAEYDPLHTTTYGTGELIADAIQRGAQRILLGVGGSATVDGGVGAAMALGWKFLDAEGKPIGLGGGELERIARIVRSEGRDGSPSRSSKPSRPSAEPSNGRLGEPSLPLPEILVLCDVDNPLCGPHGAAHVFGPQKGATPEMVKRLDAGLGHLANVLRTQLGKDIAGIPGTGAAGGLPAGAIAFCNAQLVPGIQTIMEVTQLPEAVRGADWVITGEGRFDEQSLRGKVVSGVAQLARQHGVKVAVLAGSVAIAKPVDIAIVLALRRDEMTLDYALSHAGELLEQRAIDLARRL